MYKKVHFHALAGGAIIIIGAVLYDIANITGIGDFLFFGGMVYAGVTTLFILLGVNLPSPIGNQSESPFLGEVSKEFSKRKAN